MISSRYVSGLISVAHLAAPTAGADMVAYLVNVHVRARFQLADAEAAISYRQPYRSDRCQDKLRRLVDQVKDQLPRHGYYQVRYLIDQAVKSAPRRI